MWSGYRLDLIRSRLRLRERVFDFTYFVGGKGGSHVAEKVRHPWSMAIEGLCKRILIENYNNYWNKYGLAKNMLSEKTLS